MRLLLWIVQNMLMLVIPKKHVEYILDCDEVTLCAVMKSVKKVANHLTGSCGYDGVDILSANDESEGQSLLHFHVHIIPKRYNDGLGGKTERPCFSGTNQKEKLLNEVRLQVIFTRFRQSCNGST